MVYMYADVVVNLHDQLFNRVARALAVFVSIDFRSVGDSRAGRCDEEKNDARAGPVGRSDAPVLQEQAGLRASGREV